MERSFSLKRIIWIVATPLLLFMTVILALGFSGLMISGYIIPPPTMKQLEHYTYAHFNELSYVAKDLSQMEYDYVALRKSDGTNTMYAANSYVGLGSVGGNKPISDPELLRNIKKLYSRGTSSIFKQIKIIYRLQDGQHWTKAGVFCTP